MKCYGWLRWNCGAVGKQRRVTLKPGRVTVRRFLRERFGILTGAREYWHRENWTADQADLQEVFGGIEGM